MDEGEYVNQDEEDVRKKNICQSYNQIDEVPKEKSLRIKLLDLLDLTSGMRAPLLNLMV